MNDPIGCLSEELFTKLRATSREGRKLMTVFYVRRSGNIISDKDRRFGFTEPRQNYFTNYLFAYSHSLKIKERLKADGAKFVR